MMKKNDDIALDHLRKDPILRKVIDSIDPIVWNPPPGLFEDLVEAITSQQLSIKASDTIFKRFKNLYPGAEFPVPQQIIGTADETLRGVGLSWAKVKYVKNLAAAVQNDTLDLKKLPTQTDQDVIDQLVQVKGIGIWTAEMILISTFRRPDVFSVGDLGLRKAISILYAVDIDDKKKIEKIALKWSPYRSLACKYLWRSLDKVPPPSV